MTVPAIRALKAGRPGRKVTLLASPAGAAAAGLVPEIDAVMLYDAPWMKATAPRSSAPDLALLKRLAAGRFDAAAIFTVYSQNPLPAAMMCFLADIPLRAAYCRENPYQLLTDRLPETEPQHGVRHEVRRQLDLSAALGAASGDERIALRVPPPAQRRAAEVLAALRLTPRGPWAVVHPGASAPSRRYPPELFAEAAALLVRRHGVRVVFTGSREEIPLVEHIRGRMRAPSDSLAGRLDVPELAGLIAAAGVLVSNNTGPVHLAAGVGTPVAVLYALTNPQHTPWAVPSRVLNRDVPCRNCYQSVCPTGHHECLLGVPPDEVASAAAELLEGEGSGARGSKSVVPGDSV